MLEPCTLPPLRFVPIFKSRIWGGDLLPTWLRQPTPEMKPVGEAWVLSDVDGNESRVAGGPLAGRTIRSLLPEYTRALYGTRPPAEGRFPLLLKFIDARETLSVQVHPNDEQAMRLEGPGRRGKTEAWVILHAEAEASRLYAGLRPGVSREQFLAAIAEKTVPRCLHSFVPQTGDSLLIEAGTVHAIGAGVGLFEVQQSSDITYRLYDWDRVDAKTGRPRDLHIEPALACVNYDRGPVEPVRPVEPMPPQGQLLVDCPHFQLSRHRVESTRCFGSATECQVLVLLRGQGTLGGEELQPGDTLLLPACGGPQEFFAQTEADVLICRLGAPYDS